MNVLLLLLFLFMAATAAVLLVGVTGFALGGRFNERWGNKLMQARVVLRNLLTVAAYTVKPHGGRRTPNRDARLLALRDAMLGRGGKMGPDVRKVCQSNR